MEIDDYLRTQVELDLRNAGYEYVHGCVAGTEDDCVIFPILQIRTVADGLK
jgi:hypothetical protein